MKIKPKTKVRLRALRGVLVGVLTVAIIVAMLNRSFLLDLVRTWQYEPSESVTEIANGLKLTRDGEFIFQATWPELDERDEFNHNCESSDVEISVLGCYTGGRIFVYNINSDELEGIEESTMAHELLHAVWERMGAAERQEIGDRLADVYKEGHEVLAEEMGGYSEEERLGELYARIGTELAELPEDLERHYGKYFTERGEVVAYYERYSGVFLELEKQMDELETKANALGQQIEEETSAYKVESEELAAEFKKFNDCAGAVGCFASQEEFAMERARLVAQQETLGAKYDRLDAMIDEYNRLVEEYNSSILRSERLNSLVNSNEKSEKLIK